MPRPSTTFGSLLLAALAATASAAPFVPVRDPQVVAFAPSGKLAATGVSGLSDGGFPPRPHPDVRKCGVVAIWDVATGKRLRRIETFGDLTQLAFSPDGSLLAACRLYATSDGLTLHEVRLWDVVTGRVVKTLDRCHAFDFAPDAKRLAVLSRSRCVVYDLNDWTKEHLVQPLGGCISVAWLPSNAQLVGVCKADDKYLLRLCQVDDGAVLHESLPLREPFYRVAVANSGVHLATGHEQGRVVVWNAANLEFQTEFVTGAPGRAHPFFDDAGRRLGVGSQATGDVVVWDLRTKEELHRYTFDKGSFKTYYVRPQDDNFRPEKDPTRFAFAPDGQAFLTGAYGGIVRLLEDGRDIQRFGE